jgi:Tfp pilus assembly protein PilV
MLKNERGDSLLEVIISTVIMGIIGVLLVSSIAVARPFADKMSLVGQTVQNLNSLAESINLQPYLSCSPQNSQPYSVGVPASAAQVTTTAFAISTTELPPALVSTTTKHFGYSAQLSTVNAPGAVTWQVEPLLPAGLSLNPVTGVISGESSQAITATYDFTATSGTTKVIKSIMLTSALVQVLENDGTRWTPCENIPVDAISSVTGDGTSAIYSYSGPTVMKGQTLAVWGSSNPQFNASSIQVTDSTVNTFTALNPLAGYATGGFANTSALASVQQVIVSTVVAGSPFHKVITKAAL